MKNRRSFTLLELLISISIFAVVMLSLYAAFSSGIFGLRRVEEEAVASETGYLALSRIGRDLRNAFAYSADDVKFTGQKNTLSFLTLGPEFTAVSYTLSGNNLLRSAGINKDALNTDSGIKPRVVAKNVKQIEFTYISCDPDTKELTEAGDWNDAAALPVAVRVILTLEKRENAPLSRTIYLL